MSSLTDRERAVVRAALAGGYRVEATTADGDPVTTTSEDDPVTATTADDRVTATAPPDWLVSFLARTPFVRRDGRYYRIEHDLPRYRLTATETTESAVDGPVADRAAYHEAVTHDGVRETALLRFAARGGETRTWLWPSLRSFLAAYDAVRYRGRLLSVSVTVLGDDPPYEVQATRVPPTALADDVYDATDAPAAVREVLRDAGETSGVHAGVPERLLAVAREARYVYFDGSFYWIGAESRRDWPLTAVCTVTQPVVTGERRPRLRLGLAAGDAAVTVESGAPPPFGVVAATPVAGEEGVESGGGTATRQSDTSRAGGDDAVLLWTDAYRESDHVATEGRRVRRVQSVALGTELAPGERLTRTYTPVGDLPVGEYVVADGVGVSTGGENGSLQYRVRLRVRRA